MYLVLIVFVGGSNSLTSSTISKKLAGRIDRTRSISLSDSSRLIIFYPSHCAYHDANSSLHDMVSSPSLQSSHPPDSPTCQQVICSSEFIPHPIPAGT